MRRRCSPDNEDMLEEFLDLAKRWRERRVSVGELSEVQRAAAKRLTFKDGFQKPVEAVAGVDVSFAAGRGFAAAVVVEYATGAVLDEATVVTRDIARYVPGLFVFREGPVAIEAVRRLETPFQVLMLNAHGLAHPRRCGAASHVGLVLGRPTIGVATSLLCGKVMGSLGKVGVWLPIVVGGETVGMAAIAGPRLGALYVSPGHLVSLDSSVELVSTLLRGRRLPEPLALAHALTLSLRKAQ